MAIKVTKKYLDTQLEITVEGKDLKEGLMKASIFTENDVCFLCKNEDIALNANKTQEGHIYVKRKCTNKECGATSSLGTYKDGSGYFWHNWEIYKPDYDKVKET